MKNDKRVHLEHKYEIFMSKLVIYDISRIKGILD